MAVLVCVTEGGGRPGAGASAAGLYHAAHRPAGPAGSHVPGRGERCHRDHLRLQRHQHVLGEGTSERAAGRGRGGGSRQVGGRVTGGCARGRVGVGEEQGGK